MFSSRRLAKRSIIGTRVCCCRQDGRYYPGMIRATESCPTGEDWYTVRFEDGNIRNFFEKEIIGPGFQNITIAKLCKGQKVYLTHNGREVTGTVVRHDQFTDDVLITIQPSPDRVLEVMRPLEDCRLVESRKSARLQDQDTDYSRLADLHSENKKRAVSHVIDVPLPAAKLSRRRRSSSGSDEAMVTEDRDDQEMDTMDEHMAAMVLTSLSCSPVSPHMPTGFPHDKGSPGVASSYGSSGISVMKSEPSTPSPPQLSHSAPSAHIFGTPLIDEGIELDDTHAYFMDDERKLQQGTKTVYKCTWPGCNKIMNFVDAIEKHVRDAHLEPKDMNDEDSDLSDHEEEFYYTEIEVSVDTVTDTFAEMHTSSPPGSFVPIAAQSIQDHDYQKKDSITLPQNIPLRRPSPEFFVGHGSFPLQADKHYANFSGSWQFSSLSPPVKLSKLQGGISRGLSASPKNSPMHKKSRAEVKKCRKVYGMENRDLWCTQCKWKKACSRFND